MTSPFPDYRPRPEDPTDPQTPDGGGDPTDPQTPDSGGGDGGGKREADPVEARKLSDMYSYAPQLWNSKPHHDTHQIGVRPTPIASASYTFRNNTVSTDLRIDLTLPTGSTSSSFLSVDSVKGKGGRRRKFDPKLAQLYLAPLEEQTIIFSFNELGVARDILRGSHDINSSLVWNIVPLNVAGPVYIYTDLLDLEDPNKIPEPPAPPPDEPPPPPPPEPEAPPTHLYLSLSPANPRVPFLGTQTVELIAWAGDEFVAPNIVHAMKLNFAPGSLIWAPQSSTALTIDPLDGSSGAIFRSRSRWRLQYGIRTTFTVTIIKPPINMTFDEWDELYRSSTGGGNLLGDNNATRVPYQGMLAYRLTGIAIS